MFDCTSRTLVGASLGMTRSLLDCSSQVGREFRHAASGEAWSVPSSERKSGNLADRRFADAQGTLGFGIGPGRVSGQDPSGCRTSPVPWGGFILD